MMKINPGDCNELARKRAESRSKVGHRPNLYRTNYDRINWRSKGGDDADT